MAKYIRQPSPYNTEIVALGVDTYLKMLLADNFVVRCPPLHICHHCLQNSDVRGEKSSLLLLYLLLMSWP